MFISMLFQANAISFFPLSLALNDILLILPACSKKLLVLMRLHCLNAFYDIVTHAYGKACHSPMSSSSSLSAE